MELEIYEKNVIRYYLNEYTYIEYSIEDKNFILSSEDEEIDEIEILEEDSFFPINYGGESLDYPNFQLIKDKIIESVSLL